MKKLTGLLLTLVLTFAFVINASATTRFDNYNTAPGAGAYSLVVHYSGPTTAEPLWDAANITCEEKEGNLTICVFEVDISGVDVQPVLGGAPFEARWIGFHIPVLDDILFATYNGVDVLTAVVDNNIEVLLYPARGPAGEFRPGTTIPYNEAVLVLTYEDGSREEIRIHTISNADKFEAELAKIATLSVNPSFLTALANARTYAASLTALEREIVNNYGSMTFAQFEAFIDAQEDAFLTATTPGNTPSEAALAAANANLAQNVQWIIFDYTGSFSETVVIQHQTGLPQGTRMNLYFFDEVEGIMAVNGGLIVNADGYITVEIDEGGEYFLATSVAGVDIPETSDINIGVFVLGTVSALLASSYIVKKFRENNTF